MKFVKQPPAQQTSAQKHKTNVNIYKKNTRSTSSTKVPLPAKTTGTVTNSGSLDKNFLNKVKDVAKNLNCDYNDLLALLNSESSLNPKAWNGRTAVGLLQFTNASITELNRKFGMNLTKEKIADMSPVEQLDLAEKYLSIAKSYKFPSNARLDAADLYAITFLPGRADREILCTSGENYYSANRGLDKNGDGKITKSDLAQHLAGKRVNESVFA